MTVALVPGEEDLGPQRRCPRCREFWPLDITFWYPKRSKGGWQGWCRACFLDRREATRRQQRRSLSAQPMVPV